MVSRELFNQTKVNQMSKAARNLYGWNIEGHRVYGVYGGQPFYGKVLRSQLLNNVNSFFQYIETEDPADGSFSFYSAGHTITIVEDYFYVYAKEGNFDTYIEYVAPIDI